MNTPRDASPVTTLAMVALSARSMSEAAARDGFGVLAVDLFGDADTRRACRQWWPAGPAGTLQLDPACVLAALREIARSGGAEGGVSGWVAGSGCEGLPDLVAEAATVLPLIGTAPQAMQRVRDPLAFFGFLAAHGIAHPEVRGVPPADPAGWLVKDAQGCGGWHIRAASAKGHSAPQPLRPQQYFQRRAAGVPMSATFCANGQQAVVLGYNLLTVRALGPHPYVFAGVIGPVPLAARPAQAVERALRLLCAGMALQGLCSLDFLLDGDEVLVLEVNPRVPASIALYGTRVAGGVMAAHVDACRTGCLPTLQPPLRQTGTASGDGVGPVHGTEIVFAPRDLPITPGLAHALAARADCHDLPAAGTMVHSGDPVCSVSASGHHARQVQDRLQTAIDHVLTQLECTA